MQGELSLRDVLAQTNSLSTLARLYLYLADHLNQEAVYVLLKDTTARVLAKGLRKTLEETFVLFLELFIKENVTGPSFYYHDAEQKLKIEGLLVRQILPKLDAEPYPIHLLEDLGLELDFINKRRFTLVSEYEAYFTEADSEFVLEKLQFGGESFKRVIKLSHLFLTCRVIAEQLFKAGGFDLWWGRVNFLHNQLVDNPVADLKEHCTAGYGNYFQNLGALNQDQRTHLIHIEYAFVCNYYYKYTEAEFHLNAAASQLKVKFELTGRLGLRTKFQEEKHPQLVAHIIEEEGIQQEIQELPKHTQILQEFAPQQIKLQEDSILYETPKIDDPEQIEKNARSELTLDEQILLLGFLNHYKRTLPNDEILKQQIGAYLNLMLEKQLAWIVSSQGLLDRSLNEFHHLKKLERALGQMDVLVGQFNDRQPAFSTRYAHYFAVHYPDYYSLSGIMADSWMKMGMMQSGYEIFARLEMWEECIECIVGSGDLTRAQQEIENLLKKGLATLKIRCIYAEIRKDQVLLKQVWRDSKKQFARAQRSLGELAFFRDKNYEKSIKHYRKAVAINSFHFQSWFIMGCAFMRLGRMEEAIRALGESVRVNEKDAESWGNIASCLIQLKKFKEAQASLEQGVKYASTDWRLWSNLMAVSLKNKKFVRFYSCIEKLIQLNSHELIDEQIIGKISQTFQYQVEQLSQETLRQTDINQDRLIRLYEYLVKEIGQRYYVWNGLAVLTELILVYEEKKGVQDKKQDRLNDIAEFRLKSCQMLTIVGWERDLEICEKLVRQLSLLNQDMQYVTLEESRKNMTMYVEQMRNRLESILERKIVF